MPTLRWATAFWCEVCPRAYGWRRPRRFSWSSTRKARRSGCRRARQPSRWHGMRQAQLPKRRRLLHRRRRQSTQQRSCRVTSRTMSAACVPPSRFPTRQAKHACPPPRPPLRAHGLRFSCGRAGLRQWRQADVLRRVPTRVPPSVPATGRPCLPAGFGRPGRVVVPALPPAVAAVVLHVPHPVRVVHAARVGGRGEGGRGALRLHGRRAARRAVRRAARGGAGAHGDDGARAPVAVCRSWAPT